MRTVICALAAALAGCAGLQQPAPADVAAYCTPENAFRLGSQSRAYFGGCPSHAEPAFLEALARGRALVMTVPQAYPYYARMAETEQQLLAAQSEPEREKLRTRLRELEWWAIHIFNAPGTYAPGSGRT